MNKKKDFEQDLKDINYCKENINDPKCFCINPPTDLIRIKNMPYFCWFEPCLVSTNFIPNYIKESQKRICTETNCSITIGDLTDYNSVINIINKCSDAVSGILNTFNNYDLFYDTYKTTISNFYGYLYIGVLCFFLILIIY